MKIVKIDYQNIALDTLQKALALRKKMDYGIDVPLCIFDFVSKFDLILKFEALPSLEGIYSHDRNAIVISSLRPAGRQRFTCAHEFGHHIYQHGTKIDEIIKGNNEQKHNEQEFIADCFAGFLLMPKLAVQKSFKLRNWDYQNPTPLQIYVISHYFGVGYYAKQLIFEKAYGNYLGLCRLGQFMAKAMGIELKAMICIASVASHSQFTKTKMSSLKNKLQEFIKGN